MLVPGERDPNEGRRAALVALRDLDREIEDTEDVFGVLLALDPHVVEGWDRPRVEELVERLKSTSSELLRVVASLLGRVELARLLPDAEVDKPE